MLKDYKFDEFLDLLDDGKINPSDHAAEINSWGDTELEDAKDSVTRYGFTLSNEFLKEILLQNMKLAYEVATGGISDTCCREYLVDEICRMAGLPQHPTYGDSLDKQADFQSKISTLNVSGLTYNGE